MNKSILYYGYTPKSRDLLLWSNSFHHCTKFILRSPSCCVCSEFEKQNKTRQSKTKQKIAPKTKTPFFKKIKTCPRCTLFLIKHCTCPAVVENLEGNKFKLQFIFLFPVSLQAQYVILYVDRGNIAPISTHQPKVDCSSFNKCFLNWI